MRCRARGPSGFQRHSQRYLSFTVACHRVIPDRRAPSSYGFEPSQGLKAQLSRDSSRHRVSAVEVNHPRKAQAPASRPIELESLAEPARAKRPNRRVVGEGSNAREDVLKSRAVRVTVSRAPANPSGARGRPAEMWVLRVGQSVVESTPATAGCAACAAPQAVPRASESASSIQLQQHQQHSAIKYL